MSDTRTRNIDGLNPKISKSEVYLEIIRKPTDGWAKWKISHLSLRLVLVKPTY